MYSQTCEAGCSAREVSIDGFLYDSSHGTLEEGLQDLDHEDEAGDEHDERDDQHQRSYHRLSHRRAVEHVRTWNKYQIFHDILNGSFF